MKKLRFSELHERHGGHVFAALQRVPFNVCMLSCAHTTQEVVLLTPRQHSAFHRLSSCADASGACTQQVMAGLPGLPRKAGRMPQLTLPQATHNISFPIQKDN